MDSLLRMSGSLRAIFVSFLVAGVLLAMFPGGLVSSQADATPMVDRAPEVDAPQHETIDALRTNRATKIAAVAPAKVATGDGIAIRGTAQLRAGRAAAARPVALQEKRGKRWVNVKRTRTTVHGDFRFVVRGTHAKGVRTFRAMMPRFRGLAKGQTRQLRVSVVSKVKTTPSTYVSPLAITPEGSWDPVAAVPANEAATAKGSASDWTWLYAAAGGARWDPCTVITWGYYPGKEKYAGAVSDVANALSQIAGRTGLRFRYAGTVANAPGPGMSAVSGVSLVVGWRDARGVPALAGSVVGLGSSTVVSAPRGSDVPWKAVRGWVALDTDGNLRPGFDTSGSPTWGQAMTHELLHALGLSHASAKTQLMYGQVSSVNHRFGAGDLAGMERIGATHGCLS